MPRCGDCRKFVGLDTEVEPEEGEEPTVDGLTFKASYRRVLNCAECGTELKEATIELEQDLSESLDIDCEKNEDKDHEFEFDLDVTPSMRIEGKGRGAKTFYGVEVSGTVKCAACGQEATISASDDIQASYMDEIG